MIELHPEIQKKNGKEVVVLPYEEFAALRDLLEDYEDLLDLRAAKESDNAEPSISFEEVKAELGS
jgi:PHD/YefM family antitoxin component YafN of YafNO toxin-antitoxin module